MSVKVRFAPSPTGKLHVGGARTALFNYYFAKHHGGVFCLRIEDTDQQRSTKENEEDILESLKWLGLNWTEELVYQSKRFDRYKEVVAEMLVSGNAYKCYCTTDELTAMREEMQKKGEKPKYDRRCREKTESSALPYVIRFKAPIEGEVVVKDAIAGDVTFNLRELDDFIIARSDGTPTYQLSVVVDDIDMGITHVIRGDDHLNNTPKQILLYQALKKELPVFAHLPMILGADKAKLSKRHGAVSTTVYRELGFLPESMRSYMIKLGWGHGDQELFTDEDLTKLFDLDGCRQSASVFDVKKLEWVNSQFMLTRPLDELVSLVKSVEGSDLSSLMTSPVKQNLLKGLVERSATLIDLAKNTKTFLSEDYDFDEATAAKVFKDYPKELLRSFGEKLESLTDPTPEAIHDLLAKVVEESGLGFGKVAKPLRVLVTGGLQSPDLSLVLAALGPKAVKNRIFKATDRF
ncbi:glutamate--tRNA ligase [bacterium]|nr:glutamate--tRNA ligase [bacterium]